MKTLIFPLICTTIFLSCGKKESYYQKQDFKSVKKIDTHVHIMSEDDHFVKGAKENNFQVLTIVVDSKNTMDWVKERYHYSAFQHNKYPETIEFATAFSMGGWDDPDWVTHSIAWLDSGFNEGAIAIKIWKNVGMVFRDKDSSLVMVDNPKFDAIFQHLISLKIPLIGHLGEPLNCWLPLDEMTTNNDKKYFSEHPEYHMYLHPEYPSHEEQMQARDHVLERYPELTFVGAHLGSLEADVDELAKRLDKFPNMAVDMAARMGQLFYQTVNNREKVRNFFIKYQDRLLYATDYGYRGNSTAEELASDLHETWFRDWEYFVTDEMLTSRLIDDEFQGLKLPKAIIDKIYHDNAVKWLGIFKD